ncbi:unnamed protein product [Paramecium sonneborni]|uniref:CSC1/OSCA1-like cytosolic domain-containing protein n=1 Tax=Paramecium sonneborni TaxID=65129 RepID=A0A8S1PH86_9CILI|nr:unnamed protein product [Paramecium sonneborni]
MNEQQGQLNQNNPNSPQRNENNQQIQPQIIIQNIEFEDRRKEIQANNTQIDISGLQEEIPLIQHKINQNQRTNNNFGQSQNTKSQTDFRRSIYLIPDETMIDQGYSFFVKIHEKQKNQKQCCKICCLSTGSHTFCCNSEKTQEDFIQFGVGINLYFRFLKKIGIYFIIFTLLSIPQLFFSLQSNVVSYSGNTFNRFLIFLMATTIGSTSLKNKDCQIQYFNTVQAEFSLKCDSGNLAGSSFSFGIINSNEQDCIFLSKSELNLNTTNSQSLNQLRKQIDSQEEFSFTLSQLDFINENPQGKRIYVGASCKEAIINIGSVEIQQKIIPFIFASCDAVIVILYIFFLLTLTVSEQKYKKISQKETPTLQHFSIQISSLPKSQKLIKALQNQENQQYKQLLLYEVKKFIDDQLKSVLKDQDLKIYDIQVSEKEKILQLQQELQNKKLKIQEQLKEIKKNRLEQYQEAQKHLEESIITKESYNKLFQILKQLCQNPNSEKQLIEIDQNIQKYWNDIDELSNKIDQVQQEGDSKYIWITFDTMKQKQKVQEKLQSLPKDWLYYYCCFCCFDENQKKDKFLLKKFKLQIKDAPIPENINWNNLHYSRKSRICRQLLSLFLTLIFLGGSWVLISWVNLQKTDFQQQYPSINCNNKIYNSITIEQVQQEIDGKTTIKGYVECYCKPKVAEFLQESPEICSNWKDKGYRRRINRNKFLSKWEKHLMISEEYSSRILKIFLGQFLNTGLILLLTNIDYGNYTRNDIPETIKFLFGGQYGDIDSKWCQNIGIILLLTLLINIATQPVMLLVELIVRYIRKACDQCSLCLNEKKTRAKTYQEFKELYKGEQFRVELRYAQILTALYICFMYSPALPFLFLITLLTIWFLYIVDKIAIFKTYSKPIMIDSVVSDSVRKYLWIALIIHIGFATYIYGSSNLFYETIEAKLVIEQLQDVYGNQNIVVEWLERALSQIPNIVLFAILILVLLIMFLFFFCYKPIVGCFQKFCACCKVKIFKNSSSGLDQQEQRPFLKFLKREQLIDDQKFTQFQMMLAPSIYEEKYLKLQAELLIPFGTNNNDAPIVNQDIRIEQLPLARSQVNQSDINQRSQVQQNNPGSQVPLAQSQINQINIEQNQTTNNQQKLIGLRSYHKAYNKQYRKYYEWEKMKAINILE